MHMSAEVIAVNDHTLPFGNLELFLLVVLPPLGVKESLYPSGLCQSQSQRSGAEATEELGPLLQARMALKRIMKYRLT